MIPRANSLVGLLTALVAMTALSGCSSSVTRPDAHKTSAFQPSPEFPIGQVTVATTPQVRDKLKDNLKFSADQLRTTIELALKGHQILASQPGQGVTMDVLVTRVRVRSTFNAVMWGAMAGNDAVDGEVTLKDAAGKVIDKFSVSTSYALGGFAGGQDGSRIGWLYEAFAKQVVGQLIPQAAESTQTGKK